MENVPETAFRPALGRIALTLLDRSLRASLSPFFAKARWLAVVDTERRETVFVANPIWSREWVCRTIIDERAQHVICGFIDPVSLQALAARRIEVRIAPCSIPAATLIGQFERLTPPLAAAVPFAPGRRGGKAPGAALR
jgi:predicted Fe-Mo cluster-binding NifX family protein